MHIEIWSDFVCPFCYIGKRRFDAALQNFPHKGDVTAEFKSFQLDPNTPKYNGQNYYETLAKKFGSIEQVKQMTNNVAEQAKTVGLEFNFDHAKQTDTFDAHRLNKFALQQGNSQVAEKLFQAHFIGGIDIGDKDALIKIALDSGLQEQSVREVLENADKFKADVETDLNEAKQFGVTGVPYFIINRKYAISGAQPTEAFAQALNQVWEEENKQHVFKDLSGKTDDSTICTDDSCTIPGENK